MLKEMTLATGVSHLLLQEEANTVMEAMGSGKKGSVFIERLGMAVNVAGVMSVADPVLVAFFWGMPMSKDQKKVYRDGEWVLFGGTEEHRKQITYRLKNDPKEDIPEEILFELNNKRIGSFATLMDKRMSSLEI